MMRLLTKEEFNDYLAKQQVQQDNLLNDVSRKLSKYTEQELHDVDRNYLLQMIEDL